MAGLDIRVAHRLPPQQALERIQGLLRNLQQEHKDMVKNVHEKWNGQEGEFDFTASGFNLSGKIKVEEDSVHISGPLPFALSFFKGKISQAIKEKAEELLRE
ncbi:MAG: polyhydroxyalkanoic acid system family protein [Chitinophagaceae bacterium]